MLDYMAKHASEKGYGAWTVARNLGLVPGSSSANKANSLGLGKALADTTGGDGDSVPAKDTGTFPIRPPANTKGDKQDWSDFLTSRQFIIPALTAIGTMGSAPTRNFGTALSAGLLAGAQAYQPTETSAIEQEKKRAEVQEKQVDVQIKKASMYERRYLSGIGWEVLDKSKPFSNYVRITDRNGNTLPGIDPEFGNNIPVSKESAEGPNITSGTASQTQEKRDNKQLPGTTSEIPTVTPKNADEVLNWKATTTLPENYSPLNQYDIVNTPESLAANMAKGIEDVKAQSDRAENAYKQIMELDQMQRQLESMQSMQPGAYGREKLAIGKKINDVLSILGASPMFSASDLAALESIEKGATRLGYATSSAINSREPGYIITGAIRANPNLESTPEGFRRLVNALRQEAQREVDKSTFYTNYFTPNKHTNGAKEAFNAANPGERYLSKATAETVDPAYIKGLREHGPDKQENAGKGPSLRQIIDKQYGPGTTAIIMGGGLRG
jgi:hypothetical protein